MLKAGNGGEWVSLQPELPDNEAAAVRVRALFSSDQVIKEAQLRAARRIVLGLADDAKLPPADDREITDRGAVGTALVGWRNFQFESGEAIPDYLGHGPMNEEHGYVVLLNDAAYSVVKTAGLSLRDRYNKLGASVLGNLPSASGGSGGTASTSPPI